MADNYTTEDANGEQITLAAKNLGGSGVMAHVAGPMTAAAPVTASDSVPVTPGLQLLINCTAAGNVKLGFANGSSVTIPVPIGLTSLPWAVNQVFVTGTTATATYTNLS
jgi:hypothetical protein